MQLTAICRKIADRCIGMRVRRAARVVGNYYDDHLKPAGLKGTQFTLLNAIFLNPSVTIGQLADLMLLDRTTLNRNLKPLQRQGLVRFERGQDHRTRILEVTTKGRNTLLHALPLWLQAQSGAVEILDKRIQRLVDDLRELEKLKKE